MTKQTEVDGLVEEGAAFARLRDRELVAAAGGRRAERFDVIVIGAGQSGLSVGYYLAKRGLRFVILDANARVGDTWRRRWDSLRLFTPAQLDGLAGMPFPGKAGYFPTKDEMADYLESYARKFGLPVRNSVKVERLFRRDGRYVVSAGALEFEAAHVVVAMATYQKPKVPAFARELDDDIVQLHSSDYRNPGQLRPGSVLIAGAGNSGAEIAIELAKSRRVWMAGRDTGSVPFRIGSFLGRHVLCVLLLRIVFHLVLTVKTAAGRKMRAASHGKGGPLIRTRSAELSAAGVQRATRVAGVRDGKPVLDDGTVLDVANIVWCTGFQNGFTWIDLPVFGDDGDPRHESGVVGGEPGLYFVGLHFLHAMSSTMVHGAARDAARVARTIAARLRQAPAERDSQPRIASGLDAASGVR